MKIDPFVGLDVREFGSLGSDDGPLINAAIKAAAALGLGIPVRLYHTHNIGTTVLCDISNVSLIGFGSDINRDAGTQGSEAGTKLKWVGASGGTIMQFRSPTGGEIQGGGGIRGGIYFDCNNGLADRALDVVNWREGRFDDIFVLEAAGAGVILRTVDDLVQSAATSDNYFGSLKCRQLSNDGALLVLDGSSSANSHFNFFQSVGPLHYDGHGVVMNNCDNNYLNIVHSHRPSGGIGSPVVLNGSDVAFAQRARANRIGHLSSNAALVSPGTDTFDYPASGNSVDHFDHDNNTPEPSVGIGSTLMYDWPMQSWTPSVAASSGTITSYSVTEAKYSLRRDGKVWFRTTVQISDNGTGSGAVEISLPKPSKYDFVVSGSESAGTNMLQGRCSVGTNASILKIQKAVAGAYPNTSPTFIAINGEYERA